MSLRIAISGAILLALAACNADNRRERPPAENLSEAPSGQPEAAEEYLENFNFDVLVEKYEDPERRSWQNPELVMEKLGDLEGKVAADIGAGTGYFTFRIAGEAQKVIAIDIDQRFLDYIEERKEEARGELAGNIVTRLTVEDDPALEPNEADVALVVNTYHFISERAAYFKKVKRGLKPGGRLVVVDFKRGDMPVGPPEPLKVDPQTVVQELSAAGFSDFTIDKESLQYQYIVIAKA